MAAVGAVVTAAVVMQAVVTVVVMQAAVERAWPLHAEALWAR
jgi:hypothetical protein